MHKEHSKTLLIAMVAAFVEGALSIPKRTEQGEITIVELPRELASQVINRQRGSIAPAGSKVNFKLEPDNDEQNSKLHNNVSEKNTEGGRKPKPA